MDESKFSPCSGEACCVKSPLPNVKIMPFAITTGSPWSMSRETQTGTSSGLEPGPTTLNAATPPFTGAGVFVEGNLNWECTGPQNGAITQRVPFESCQL